MDNTSSLDQHATNTHTASFQDKSLSDFYITSAQKADALAELKDEMKSYLAVSKGGSKQQKASKKKTLLNIQDYFSVTKASHTEKSEASAWKGRHLMRTTGIFLCWRPSLTTVWDRNTVSPLHALGVPMRDLSR